MTRPLDVLAFRDILHRDLEHNESLKSYIVSTAKARMETGFGQQFGPETLIRSAKGSIRVGETFLVTQDMAELADWAQSTMPPEPLVPQDMPSSHGFMWVEGGIQTADVRGTINSTSAFTWATASNGVVVMAWAYKYDKKDEVNKHLHESDPDRIARVPTLMWTGWTGAMRFGDIPWRQQRATAPIPVEAEVEWIEGILYADGVPVETEEGEPNHEMSWLIAAWRLMQQTLAAVRKEEVAAKKVRRFDLKDTLVSVITLRHRVPSREIGETNVEWHHRWIVRAHWRNQPYKSEDGSIIYRAILILPYIKGPEGAPLKRSEKVNVWKQ